MSGSERIEIGDYELVGNRGLFCYLFDIIPLHRGRFRHMNSKQILPEFEKTGFSCPHCHFNAHQVWSRNFVYNNYLMSQFAFEQEQEKCAEFGEELAKEVAQAQDIALEGKKLCIAVCQQCDDFSIWLEHKGKAMMVYPDTTIEPLSEHVNEEIRELFLEAATIYTRSPRAANALLRLVVEKLCKQILGFSDNFPNKPNLHKMIDLISKEYKIKIELVKAMENTRTLGNESAHGGIIDLDDIDDPLDIFLLVRYIVQHCVVDEIEAKRINKSIHQNLQKNKNRNR